MIRTGRPRARRILPFAAVVMLLLVLAASALVSAGSPHHAHPAASGVTAGHGAAAGHVTAAGRGAVVAAVGHEHKHGNDWTPTLGKRVRPAATVSVVGTLPARLDELGPAPDTAVSTHRRSGSAGDRLNSLSVWRV